MKKKDKKTTLSPEIYERHERLQTALRGRLELLARRDAEVRREAAERFAYHELQQAGKPSWKDALDEETRRRVEARADQILGESQRG